MTAKITPPVTLSTPATPPSRPTSATIIAVAMLPTTNHPIHAAAQELRLFILATARDLAAKGERATGSQLAEMLGSSKSAVNTHIRMIRADPEKYGKWPFDEDGGEAASSPPSPPDSTPPAPVNAVAIHQVIDLATFSFDTCPTLYPDILAVDVARATDETPPEVPQPPSTPGSAVGGPPGGGGAGEVDEMSAVLPAPPGQPEPEVTPSPSKDVRRLAKNERRRLARVAARSAGGTTSPPSPAGPPEPTPAPDPDPAITARETRRLAKNARRRIAKAKARAAEAESETTRKDSVGRCSSETFTVECELLKPPTGLVGVLLQSDAAMVVETLAADPVGGQDAAIEPPTEPEPVYVPSLPMIVVEPTEPDPILLGLIARAESLMESVGRVDWNAIAREKALTLYRLNKFILAIRASPDLYPGGWPGDRVTAKPDGMPSPARQSPTPIPESPYRPVYAVDPDALAHALMDAKLEPTIEARILSHAWAAKRSGRFASDVEIARVFQDQGVTTADVARIAEEWSNKRLWPEPGRRSLGKRTGKDQVMADMANAWRPKAQGRFTVPKPPEIKGETLQIQEQGFGFGAGIGGDVVEVER